MEKNIKSTKSELSKKFIVEPLEFVRREDGLYIINEDGNLEKLPDNSPTKWLLRKLKKEGCLNDTDDTQNEHIAWCPVCFDALDVFELENKDDKIEGHIYNCIGCEKTFELKEFDLDKRCFANPKQQVNKEEKFAQ